MSPERRRDLHDPHWPSLQPCMSAMPCRKAASKTVSPSWTSISTPTGSNRTLYVAVSDITDQRYFTLGAARRGARGLYRRGGRRMGQLQPPRPLSERG